MERVRRRDERPIGLYRQSATDDPPKDVAMYLCVICRFMVELDDAILPTDGGCCVCCRCFSRDTETTLEMPGWLRAEVVAVLVGAEVT